MKEIRLGDYIELLTDYHSGGSYKTLKDNTKILYNPDYAVMVRTVNFEKNNFLDDLIYCDKDSYSFLKYSHVRENDVLMNKIANPGSVYIMPKVDYRATCGMNLFLLRFKNINQRYMYYVMKNSEEYIKAQSHGTTTKTITKEEVKNLKFLIHEDINIQNRIEAILSSIDYKIETNKKIILNQQTLAKTIYNYWFLQFEFPNKEGKPYKSSGGKMKWNDDLKKDIPYDWEVDYLKNKFTISRGISYTSKDIAVNNGVPMINLACVDINRNYKDGELKYYNGKISEQALLKGGDLLIACTDLTRNAEIVGSPILTPFDNDYTYSMDMVKLIPSELFFNKYYLYMTLRTDSYHKYIKKWASGTNVLHLNLDGINWFKTWIPTIDIQNKYAKIIESINERENLIFLENRKLTELKQFLLPMLMNGQINFYN